MSIWTEIQTAMGVRFNRNDLLVKLISRKHNHRIKIITGVRRCGKSYLLFELFKEHLLQNGVDEQHIIEVDLENRRNQKLRFPDALLTYIDNRMTDDKMYYILLDEVQLVPEFEDVLNSYLKIKNADVYVTGSNSKFLSTDIVTEFRGRGDEVRVWPLSFTEIKDAFPEKSNDEIWKRYYLYGGMPQVVLDEDDLHREDTLKGLFTQTYLRDIVERHHLQHEMEMQHLLDIVASGVGGLTNPQKLSDSFKSMSGSSLSAITIKQYLDYLEDAFLIAKSMRYDVKGKRYISTPYKCYFVDSGLRNARLNFRQSEQTHLMENIIYVELLRRGYSVDVGVVDVKDPLGDGRYQRKHLEVDFVVNRGSERLYIQSAFALPSLEKTQQEKRPLVSIPDSFRKIIVVKEDIMPLHDDEGILTISLWDFLLRPELMELS